MKKRQTPFLAALGFILVLAPFAAKAQSNGVQMLPPTQYPASNTEPCTSTSGGLLFWDGVNPIKCIPGTTGNATGSLIQANNGELQTGSSGAACTGSNAGAMRYLDKQMYYCDGSAWRPFSCTPAATWTTVTFDQPGEYNFTVPPYCMLIVELWGGGGSAVSGQPGGESVWNNTVIARGGPGSVPVNESGNGRLSTGGTASGGDINAGGLADGTAGGPNGGIAGCGRWDWPGNGKPSSNFPGGGGMPSQSYSSSGLNAFYFYYPGGGAGYALATYAPGNLAIGGSIPLVVGSGGAGGNGYGNATGCSGGDGEVIVMYK